MELTLVLVINLLLCVINIFVSLLAVTYFNYKFNSTDIDTTRGRPIMKSHSTWKKPMIAIVGKFVPKIGIYQVDDLLTNTRFREKIITHHPNFYDEM